MRVSDVLADLGRPIVIYPALVRALDGSVPAAMMLTQLLYWTGKGSDPQGWVHKVESEWEEELTLTPKRVKNARTMLVDLGLVEHKRRGIPALPCYRVNADALDQWWGAHVHDSGPDQSASKGPDSTTPKRPDRSGSKGPDIPYLEDDYIDDLHRAPAPPAKKRRTAAPLPEAFPVTEIMAAWAKAKGGHDLDLEYETTKFLDHHRGRGNVMKDWEAAWRNWIRNAVEFKAARPGAKSPTAAAEEYLAGLTDEERNS